MNTCATCKWQPCFLETYRPIGLSDPDDWYCACPEVQLPLVCVSPVTGKSWYESKGGGRTQDPRPRCVDVNPTGDCQWWEEGEYQVGEGSWADRAPRKQGFWKRPDEVAESLPTRRSLWQRLLGI